jgi:3-dehydroquinate synthetase
MVHALGDICDNKSTKMTLTGKSFGTRFMCADSRTMGSDIAQLMATIDHSTTLLLIDRNVAAAFPDLLELAGNRTTIWVGNSDGTHRSFSYLERFTDRFYHHVDSDSLVIGIGGSSLLEFLDLWCGVVHQGIRFAVVPTSATSLANAVHGGRQLVTSDPGPRGLRHQPEFGYLNPAFLEALPQCHFRSGMVESVRLALFNNQAPQSIMETAKARARLLAGDPGGRAEASQLWYGQPFAAAFAACHRKSRGERLPTGQSLALGMLLVAQLAQRLRPELVGQVAEHRTQLERFVPLATLVRDLPTPEALISHLTRYATADNDGSEDLQVPACFLASGWHSVPRDLVVEVYRRWFDNPRAVLAGGH